VLHKAAGSGSEGTVRLLVEKGADVTATDKNGVTVLHEAAGSGREGTVRLLIDKGADARATDKNGETVS
jgi:ankyrin repeat protein